MTILYRKLCEWGLAGTLSPSSPPPSSHHLLTLLAFLFSLIHLIAFSLPLKCTILTFLPLLEPGKQKLLVMAMGPAVLDFPWTVLLTRGRFSCWLLQLEVELRA